MSPSDNWLSGEPQVNELMADPILHLVLRRDRLPAQEVWRTLRHAQERLRLDRHTDGGQARRASARGRLLGPNGGGGR